MPVLGPPVAHGAVTGVVTRNGGPQNRTNTPRPLTLSSRTLDSGGSESHLHWWDLVPDGVNHRLLSVLMHTVRTPGNEPWVREGGRGDGDLPVGTVPVPPDGGPWRGCVMYLLTHTDKVLLTQMCVSTRSGPAARDQTAGNKLWSPRVYTWT